MSACIECTHRLCIPNFDGVELFCRVSVVEKFDCDIGEMVKERLNYCSFANPGPDEDCPNFEQYVRPPTLIQRFKAWLR